MCPNGRKKSHCMLVRRAACSQLCLGVKIGRNVHTAHFKGRRCSYHPLQRAECSYRPKLDCPRLTISTRTQRDFFQHFGHKTSCVSRVTWWRCDSCEYRPRYARAGTLRTRHNRHHAALGTQSTNVSPRRRLLSFVPAWIDIASGISLAIHGLLNSRLKRRVEWTESSTIFVI